MSEPSVLMLTAVVEPMTGSVVVKMRSLTFDPTVWAVLRSKPSVVNPFVVMRPLIVSVPTVPAVPGFREAPCA